MLHEVMHSEDHVELLEDKEYAAWLDRLDAMPREPEQQDFFRPIHKEDGTLGMMKAMLIEQEEAGLADADDDYMYECQMRRPTDKNLDIEARVNASPVPWDKGEEG